MICALDTSAYYNFSHGDSRLEKWFHTVNEIRIPLVVIGELSAGFAAGNRRELNEQLLQKFLDAPNVRTVTITNDTTSLFAAIYLSLREKGKPIGTNDMWIAAMSLEHDVALLTTNNDFSNVPDLMLVKIQGWLWRATVELIATEISFI